MFDLSVLYGLGLFSFGYLFGAISAFFVLRKERQFKFEPKQIERMFILATVTAIWTISNAVAIFNANYDSPNALHALFGAIVGFYFDITIFNKLGLIKKK